VSGQPIEQRYANNPDEPVDAADRAAVEELLKTAFTEGDIDMDAFFSGLEQLWAATSGGELVPLIRSLPGALRQNGPVLGGDSVGGPPGVAPKGPSIFQRRR
jgi:hypothetical protein